MGTNTVKKEISLYKGAEMTETEIKSMIDKDLYESILNAFTWERSENRRIIIIPIKRVYLEKNV